MTELPIRRSRLITIAAKRARNSLRYASEWQPGVKALDARAKPWLPKWPVTPSPPPSASSDASWRAWLRALADDENAAWSAADVYAQLDPASRQAWLDALARFGDDGDTPPLALYGPLLATERDPSRLGQIRQALGHQLASYGQPQEPMAFEGKRLAGVRASYWVVFPLYLTFVSVLRCSIGATGTFISADADLWRRWDPKSDRPPEGMEGVPWPSACDDICAAIVAQRRAQRDIPEPLQMVVPWLHVWEPIPTPGSS